jgi:hypothetical protein
MGFFNPAATYKSNLYSSARALKTQIADKKKMDTKEIKKYLFITKPPLSVA